MGFLKRKQKGEQNVITLGCIDIPYQKIINDGQTFLKIGCLSIPYEKYEKDESHYLKIFGFNICIDRLIYNRKKAHYLNRDKLTNEYCKKLLKKELKDDLGYIPNIDNPQTLNEKILWLKFNDHNPLITKCCDKYAVKDYVTQTIGQKYILPNLGVWKKAEDIDFDRLPDQFALKVNWSSGYNIIVPNKNELDINLTRKKLNSWMKPEKNSYYDTFNWGYKDVEPVIYAEPYIEQFDGQVYDYKFFIVNGKFKFMLIATDRHKNGLTFTWFDSNFERLPCTRGNHPSLNPPPLMPQNLHKMIELAEKLSAPFKFVRVDFYELNEKEVYVGEMTFYPAGGTSPFKPSNYDYKFGAYLDFV